MNLALLNGTIEDHNNNSFNSTIAEAIANIKSNAMVLKMQCVKFSGISNDKFCLKIFFSEFENCVANMRSN